MGFLIGPGHLFDFDLTLPVFAVEFLTLMVILSKTWFGPVGKVLDDRDKVNKLHFTSYIKHLKKFFNA